MKRPCLRLQLAISAALAATLLPGAKAHALELTARSVALPGPPASMCAMALDQGGRLAVGSLDFTGSTRVAMTNCDLYNNSGNVDSLEVSGSASLSARDVYLAGGYSVGGNSSVAVTGAVVTYGAVVQDPYAGLPVPQAAGCDHNNYRLGSGGSATIAPGVYCGGITVTGGASLTLQPGTYILDQGNLSISGNSTISGQGVTIVLTSSSGNGYGTIGISGGATVTLSAPTQNAALGIPGIVLWEDANAPTANASVSGGASQVITGAIYLPSQQVSFTGGSSVGSSCVQLIGLTLTFAGNSYFKHSCADSGVKDPPAPPRVVQ